MLEAIRADDFAGAPAHLTAAHALSMVSTLGYVGSWGFRVADFENHAYRT